MAKPEITDIISQLPHHAGNAAKYLRTRALKKIQAIIVHYNGPAVHATEMAQLIGDANYHISGRYWSKDGSGVFGWAIMYRFAVGQSGTIYEMNPLEDILWHVTNGNGEALGILCIIGKGQQPTKAMLKSLEKLVDWLTTERPDFPAVRANVWGHGECKGIYGGGPQYGNSTECPGSPLLAWVRDYRNGAPHTQLNGLLSLAVLNLAETDGMISFPNIVPFMIDKTFKILWTDLGGIATSGYPISHEYQDMIEGVPLTVQDFENVQLEWARQGQQPRVGGANRRYVEVKKGITQTA